MAKGFWKGVIAGGVVGSLFSNLLFSPQKKLVIDKEIRGKTRYIKAKAQKAVQEASEGVKGIWRK